MGGAIEVDSSPTRERGAVFQFTAQFGCQFGSVVEDRGEPIAHKWLCALVVDDNATNLAVLEELLSNWRMRPVGADGGREPWLHWKSRGPGEPYRLVLLDSQMPDMQGLEVAPEIRRRSDLAGVILMLLLSDDRPGDMSRCQELGISAFLRKPIKQSELLDAILTALHQSPRKTRPIAMLASRISARADPDPPCRG